LGKVRATASASDGRTTAQWGREITTLGGAFRDFMRRRSPWLIIGAIVLVAAARIAIGGFGWADVVAVAGMLVVYPFGEWAIHVYLLHKKPFRFRDKEVELISSRAHRAHHRDPTNLDQLLLFEWQVASLLVAVLLVAGVGALIGWLVTGGTSPAVLSAVLTGYVLVFNYEWTHFLIHTAYVPRTQLYKRVWRNHRLHHFKNEHFWHGVTNNFSDVVLGTNPDQREVERSQTARTLGAGPVG
jgi:Fatty acid hydroxylase superfamily